MDEVCTSRSLSYQSNDLALFYPQIRPVGELTCSVENCSLKNYRRKCAGYWYTPFRDPLFQQSLVLSLA